MGKLENFTRKNNPSSLLINQEIIICKSSLEIGVDHSKIEPECKITDVLYTIKKY